MAVSGHSMNNILKHNLIDQFGDCEASKRVFDIHYSRSLDWRHAERIAQEFHDLSNRIRMLLEIAKKGYTDASPEQLADLHQFIMTREFNRSHK